MVVCGAKKLQRRLFLLLFLLKSRRVSSPPLVCSNIAAASKPRVEDEDATERLTPSDPSEQRRIVREPETLAEPVHCVLLPRTLPSHLSHRGGAATPPCWQRPAGRLRVFSAVQLISRTQKRLPDAQLQLPLCTAALSQPPIGWSASSAASSPRLLLAERLTLLGWTSRWLTAAQPPPRFRFGWKVSTKQRLFTEAFAIGTGHDIYIRQEPGLSGEVGSSRFM